MQMILTRHSIALSTNSVKVIYRSSYIFVVLFCTVVLAKTASQSRHKATKYIGHIYYMTIVHSFLISLSFGAWREWWCLSSALELPTELLGFGTLIGFNQPCVLLSTPYQTLASNLEAARYQILFSSDTQPSPEFFMNNELIFFKRCMIRQRATSMLSLGSYDNVLPACCCLVLTRVAIFNILLNAILCKFVNYFQR